MSSVPPAIEDYLPWVRTVARKTHARSPRVPTVAIDDLVQEGALALADCLRTYDPARNSSLEGYAYLRVRGAMVDAARRARWGWSKHRGWRGDRRLVYVDSWNALDFHDLLADQQDALVASLERRDTLERIACLLGALDNPREREVIGRHYLEGEKIEDIARTYGITPSRVSQIHRSALAKLRAAA